MLPSKNAAGSGLKENTMDSEPVRIETACQTDLIQNTESVETQTDKEIQRNEIFLDKISQIENICSILRKDVEMNGIDVEMDPIQNHKFGTSTTDKLEESPKVIDENIDTNTESEPYVTSSFGLGVRSNVVAATTQEPVVTSEIDKQETPDETDRDNLNSTTVHNSSSGATSAATVRTAPQTTCVENAVMADWNKWSVGALLYVPISSLVENAESVKTVFQIVEEDVKGPKFFAGTFLHTLGAVYNGTPGQMQTKLKALGPARIVERDAIVSDDLISVENSKKHSDSLNEVHLNVAKTVETEVRGKPKTQHVVKEHVVPDSSENKKSPDELNFLNDASSENIQTTTQSCDQFAAEIITKVVDLNPGEAASSTDIEFETPVAVDENRHETEETNSVSRASSPSNTLGDSPAMLSAEAPKNIDTKFDAEFPSLSDTARVVTKKDRSYTRIETYSDANALGFQWKKSSSGTSLAGEQTRQKKESMENSKPRSTVQKQRQKHAIVKSRQNVAIDGKQASMEKLSTVKNVNAETVEKKSERKRKSLKESSPKQATENKSKLRLATGNVFSCLEVDMDHSIESEAQNAEEVARTTEITSSADPLSVPTETSTNETDESKSSIETEKTEELAKNKKIGKAERKRQSRTKKKEKATEEDWDVMEKLEEKRINDDKREMEINIYTYLDRMTEYRTVYFALHRKKDSSSVPSFEGLAADIFDFSKDHMTSSTEDHEKLQKFLKRRLQEYEHSSKKVESNYKLHQLFDVLMRLVSTTQAFKHYLVLAQDMQFLEVAPRKDLKKMEKLYVKLVETFPKENEAKTFDNAFSESVYRCETNIGENYLRAFRDYVTEQFAHRFKPIHFYQVPFQKEGSRLQYNLYQFVYGNQPNCDITRLMTLLADEVEKLQDGAEKELQRKFISFLSEFDSLIISCDILAHCDAYFNTGSSHDHIRDSKRQNCFPPPWLAYEVPSPELMFGPLGYRSNVAQRHNSNRRAHGSQPNFQRNQSNDQRAFLSAQTGNLIHGAQYAGSQIVSHNVAARNAQESWPNFQQNQPNDQRAFSSAQVANSISGRQYPGFQMILHNVTGGNVPANVSMVKNSQPIGPKMQMQMQSIHSNWNQCGTSEPVRIETACQTDLIQNTESVETQTDKEIQRNEIFLDKISQIENICSILRKDVEMNGIDVEMDPIQNHKFGTSTTDKLEESPKVIDENIDTNTESEPDVTSSFGLGVRSNVVAATTQEPVVTSEIDKQETPDETDRDNLNSTTVHNSSSGATSAATVRTATQTTCVENAVMADWNKWSVGALLYVPISSLVENAESVKTVFQIVEEDVKGPKFFAGTFLHTLGAVYNGTPGQMQTKLKALGPARIVERDAIVSDDLISVENSKKHSDSLNEVHLNVAKTVETEVRGKPKTQHVVKEHVVPDSSENKKSPDELNFLNDASSENIQTTTQSCDQFAAEIITKVVDLNPGEAASSTDIEFETPVAVDENRHETEETNSVSRASSPSNTLGDSPAMLSAEAPKNIDTKFDAEFPSLSDTARVVTKKDRSYTRIETYSDANALGFQWKKSSSRTSPAGEQTRQKKESMENSKPRSTVQKQRQKQAIVKSRQNVAIDGKQASMEKLSTVKNVNAETVEKKSERKRKSLKESSPKQATENKSKLRLATGNVFSCLEVDMDHSIESEAQIAEVVARTTESTSSAEPMGLPTGTSTNETDQSKSSSSSQKKNRKNKKKKKKTAQSGNDCIPEAPFDEEEESDPIYMCVNTYYKRMVDHRVRYMAFKTRDGSSTVPHFDGLLKKILDYSFHRQGGGLFSGTEVAMAIQFVTSRMEHYRNLQNRRLFQFFKCLESIMKDEFPQPPVVLIQDILYIIERCKTNQEKVDGMYFEAVQKFSESETVFNSGFIDMELGKDIIDEEYRKHFLFYLQIQFRLRYCSSRSTDREFRSPQLNADLQLSMPQRIKNIILLWNRRRNSLGKGSKSSRNKIQRYFPGSMNIYFFLILVF
ncbi:hypothetical protein L5515_018377 [Caenorhabditis briggsae]|uniref:Uncharacterized protein n=1 Tax=Caenorhabditis briggsae TaxID=6238 RepID=A0AAE9FHW6_CAEBR|nr:hypothetical protein L5515_018377 [Caenorhabditis briggsae]